MTNKIEDIWNRIDRRGPNDCWLWSGDTNNTGYGSFRLYGKKRTVHRLVYHLTFGVIEIDAPTNKRLAQFVLHRCDNRLCCNPAHLFLGNYADNMKDAKKKGRTRAPQGDQHPKAALTNSQAAEARRLLSLGLSRRHVREVFNVSERIMDRIARNQSYRTT